MTFSDVSFIRQAESLFQRRTSSRRILLNRILDKAQHFSAEEVCREVPEVGRATVYRTLSQLNKAGLLCRVPLDGGNVHYQLALLRHHHHLVCLRCDQVIDVESCDVAGFAQEIANSNGFDAITHSLEIHGVCPSCQETNVSSPPVAVH